ncbi:MAG: class II aldolase/adducin family protein [Defluviitaleaceae bacterium]|nr:class II aldolase/adducin family protein [Defluviitaleaceae bacterium]
MKSNYLHPADQLVAIMNRIYERGLTTTSGGNLSILEDNGDIWITPSGIDKGALTRADICCVKPDGTVEGLHAPSVELPFHALVYKKRPDIRAVLHAHPPHMVAFSVARCLPALNLIANARQVCGKLAMAPYAVPGSPELGEKIAAEFVKGFHIVVMENHGLVVGSGNLFDCYLKFETLENTAQTQMLAGKLGALQAFDEDDYIKSRHIARPESFVVGSHNAEENAARRDMIFFIRRAYRQGLIGAASGTFSARLSNGQFLITPAGADRAHLTEGDLVLMHGACAEYGKMPSRLAVLHKQIYDRHPQINSIMGAQPPHAMAFAVTDAPFDSRTIPESYIMLRNMKKTTFRNVYHAPEAVAEVISPRTPVVICENNQILATGATLLQAFDRLEVCEATAKAIIAAKDIGALVRISDEEVADIDRAFKLP